MKTILYNPIFINPQAYYVFPRLTRYLQPDNESTAEPANYIGTIEVKVIAYGDTTLKRTYTNTDSIDLSEFKNTWIRISLFTKVGSCVLGEWKIGNMESDLPYIDPEVLASLKAVVIVGNKTNNDSDRAIVKNLVDPDNPFVISNAAFKLNSGFGKYEVDFTSWIQTNGVIASSDKVQNSITGRFLYFNTVNKKEDVPSFKVNITLGQQSKLQYNYIKEDGTSTYIVYSESGIYTIPASYFSKYTGGNAWFGFYQIEGTSIIEQIPSFEGAFVTDGIDDLITSTKTVQEMLGGSNEITVVSMIHLVQTPAASSEKAYTNQIRTGQNYLRNYVTNSGKTGIYGYTYKGNNVSVINNILGDKNDYTVENKSWNNLAKFSVIGYEDNGTINELDQVAWYWTIIANKVLTTDQINQVIAYFNLDRTLNPDILCNTIKQGITNENHAEFGDKLIDFSGNGRDIQLNNLAWDGDSGIGKYNYPNWKVNVTQGNKYARIVYYDSINGTYSANFKGITDLYKSYGLSIEIRVNRANTVDFHSIKEDGIYTMTPPDDTTSIDIRFGGENIYNASCDITITQIPSHAGALCLDGVNDYGKVTGMPIYKDYTVVTDREIFANTGAISSKNNPGAFVETSGNSVYSFGQGTSGLNFISTRSISYLSKYSYCGQSITAGAAEDGTDMWLGTIRDNDSRFFNGTIYSLMTFPYSMSEFLIERQLKKHKLGTLYPNMVEFRPVIKSSVELVNKPTFAIRGTSTLLNAGDYIPENSEIWVVITMNNAADRITKFVINGNTIDIPSSAYNPSTMKYGFPFTIDNKSPQKITMTIEQDENYVQWNPVVTSNVEYVRLDFYLNNYQKRINIGDYIPKDAYLRANLYLKNNVDELTVFTFNGVNIDYKRSVVDDTAFNIGAIYNYDSPQEVNITVDEYIRYEDIVQPYPVVFQIKDRNTNQIYSWGDKIKVGSSIQLTQGENPNLLSGLYSVQSYEYEGETYTYNQLKALIIIITKSGIQLSCNKVWTFDDNEPKCILSPRLLRIPNSSYKILGYIPDISGHGNNGKINNSAYAGMSGANGYPYDYKNGFMAYSNCRLVDSETFNVISISPTVNIIKNTPTYKGKIKVTGLSGYLKLRIYPKDDSTNAIEILEDGVYDINIDNETGSVYFHVAKTKEGSNDISVIIQQVGEYEGAYCLDGVDDFVTIPTTVGGKQVLMKVNWQSIAGTAILYDQRTNGGFAIFNRDFDTNENKVPAYRARNIGGSTYIDGILNKYIYASELKDITHNIVELCDPELNTGTLNPKIGSSYLNSNYTQMSLFDFMLFDEISTDDKIQELNEYVGVEAKVELPPYYWDTYGKTNSDVDRDTIQQRGVAVGDYDLTNYNHAYEGMSGYNGYPVVFDANKTWETLSSVYGYISDVTSTTIHVTMVKNAGTGLLFSYVKKDEALTNIKEIPAFRVTIKGLEGNSKLGYRYLATEDATGETLVYLGNGTHELAKSFAPTEALLDLTRNAWVGIFITPMVEGEVVFDCDITIEVLPEYENGLAYDGVEDYSKNVNVPAFTEYTYIYKRTIINIPTNAATLLKGADKTNGGAFIADYGNKWQFNFGQYNIIQGIADGINWQTVNSFNGTSINKGENTDDSGITVAKFSNGYTSMVFYKLILYPKTISLLEINFLKNLMEKDEIIDLNNPIFIQE